MNEITRKERKFLITLEQMYRDTHILSQVLREDPHNRGDGYMIRSLYFDTLDDRDFHEKEDGVAALLYPGCGLCHAGNEAETGGFTAQALAPHGP